MNTELKPCPFCGGEGIKYPYERGWRVKCENNCAILPAELGACFTSEKNAIDAWNSRVSSPVEVGGEEIWDKHSENIGNDIDDLSYWAGRTVLTKENFLEALDEYGKELLGLRGADLRTFAYRWFSIGRSQEKPYTDKPEDFETLWNRDQMIPRGEPAENKKDSLSSPSGVEKIKAEIEKDERALKGYQENSETALLLGERIRSLKFALSLLEEKGGGIPLDAPPMDENIKGLPDVTKE